MQNLESVIMSEFANSPVINQLITNMNTYLDQSANVQGFLSTVWNINTAVGFGLDFWGNILGVKRLLQIAAAGPFFGFDQSGSMVGFQQGVFLQYIGETTTFSLLDDAYRKLLLAKALGNITRTTIGGLNQLISNLFTGRGRCYCTDSGSMTMTYTFEFVLTPVELAILTQSGVLIHPTGVGVTIVQLPLTTGVFGFNGSGLQTFNNGTFFNSHQVIL